jgi:hypothetical protein
MNTQTDTLVSNTPKTGGGHLFGQSASDLIGFYGKTPVAQPAGASQGAITDNSGGTSNLTTGVTTITGTYNSTILANAFATTLAQLEEIRASLVDVGILKGSA